MKKSAFSAIYSLLFCLNVWGETSSFACNSKEPSLRQILLEKLAGEWITHCIYTATELHIPEYLQSGPKSIAEIAFFTKTKEDLLYRFMNTLASNGIFLEFDEKMFSNNSMSELLSPLHPHSLYDLTLFYKEVISPNWPHLTNTLTTATTSFEIKHGIPVFQYFKETPTAAARFNAAMKSKSNAVVDSLLKVYDFSNISKLYDIGAGNGHFTHAVLRKYLNLSGTIFEVPRVVESATASLPSDIASRCSFAAGDFFKSIPDGGDLYFLKSVIHDWSDADSLKILKNLHDAMSSNSRLLIVELVLLGPNVPDYGKSLDLLMMTITGGRERSLEEIRQLLDLSGFELTGVYSTDTEFSIIEAKKKGF